MVTWPSDHTITLIYQFQLLQTITRSPKPHSQVSSPSLIPKSHSQASLPCLIPKTHSQVSFPSLISKPHFQDFQGSQYNHDCLKLNPLVTKLPFGNIHAQCTKLSSCQTATFVHWWSRVGVGDHVEPAFYYLRY